MLQGIQIGHYAQICLRLLIACGCGAVIGLERSKRFKGVGIRTHVIVCCAAALIMVISKYGFSDLAGEAGFLEGTRGADPARIAAQVISGTSFLCAGVIFRAGSTVVKGLTTAAGIWFTAGVGLSLGAGMYFIGIFSTAVIAVLQLIMHKFQVGGDSYISCGLSIKVSPGTDFNRILKEQIEEWDASVTESKVTRNSDGTVEYMLTVRRHSEISFEEFDRFLDANGEIISASRSVVQ